MSLFGGIYVGTSGLQTSQNSLNTTAHNLSNEGTTGYVRQQVYTADRIYNTIRNATATTMGQQVGLGVTYAKVRQVRDYFLDLSYRKENGRSAFYDTSFAAISEAEDLLNELNDDASFNRSLTDLWSTIQELSKTPDDTSVQRMLIQNAQTFLNTAKQVYQGLVDYQTVLNTHIKEKVDRINELGKTIYELNDSIRKVECGGVETANDLRDARNQALDELSGLANITYSEDIYGSYNVSVEGVNFVTGDMIYKMDVVQDPATGYYTPYWVINAENVINEDGSKTLDISKAKVFNLSDKISSEKNTDVGELRAMLYARGDKNADFTDIPIKPTIPDDKDYAGGVNDPQYIKDVEQYLRDLDDYNTKVTYYNRTIAQSVCMNIEAEFDQLVHNVATAVNNVLYQVYESSNGLYMADDNGMPLEIFQRTECEAYTFNQTTGKWEHVEEITDDDYYSDTLYSISNLQINPVLVREAGKLQFRKIDGTVDYETAKAMADAFDADIYSLNPNVTTKCSLGTYYTNLVSQIANSGSVYKNMATTQQATVDSINYSREQVQGVSSDEELNNMIKFQNAYNAASRYINVINECLENLINNLA